MGGGANASLQLLIELRNEASQGLQQVATDAENTSQKGAVLQNAFSFALGGAVTAGVSALGGQITSFFGDAIGESQEWSAGVAQLGAVLESTGGKAGVTSQQAQDLASSLSAANGVSMAADDAVLKGENLLLTFTNIGSDVFPQATQTMVDMAQAMGTDVSGGAIQLGKALNDPTQGLTALTRVGVTFTDAQKNQIKTMQDAGDMAGAQKVILDELSKEFGGSAAAAADTFAGKQMQLSEAFKNVEQSVGDTLVPLLTQFMGWLGSPEVMGVIQGLADALAQGLTGAINFLVPLVNDLAQAFINAWPTLQNIGQFLTENAVPVLILLGSIILSQVVPAFIAWATTMLTTTLPALLPVVAATLAAAAPFVALGLVIAALWIAFQNNFLGIRDLVTQVWQVAQPVIQAFQQGWDTLTKAFQTGGILGVLQAIPGVFGQIGQAIGTFLAQAGPMIGAWIQGLWTQFQTALPGILAALGQFVQQALQFLAAAVPQVLATLAQWGLALIQWILPQIPPLLGFLAQLLGSLLGFLISAVPQIIGQLLQWAGALLSWIWTDVIPQLPGWLAQVIQLIMGWIQTNGPTILAQLAVWAQSFFDWIGSLLSQLPGWLGTVISAVWNWITTNGPTILAKLAEWSTAFQNWVTQSVLPQLGTWLGQIATALWQWLSSTATDLGAHLVNEWIPAFWNWITGPGGVLATIGAKLLEIAQKVWDWITSTAADAATKVLTIGQNIVSGIQQGIQNGWQGFLNWVTGMLGSVVDAVKNFFGIHSASTLMADLFEELPNGMVAGLDAGMPAVKDTLMGHLQDLQAMTESVGLGTIGAALSGAPVVGGVPVQGVTAFSSGSVGLGALSGAPGGGAGGTIRFDFTGMVINAGPGTNGQALAADFVAAVSQQVGDRLRQMGVY
jgi:hypothetical protein